MTKALNAQIVSLNALAGLTVAAISRTSKNALEISFDDGSQATLCRDPGMEGSLEIKTIEDSLEIKTIEGDLQALVGGELDTPIAEFEDVHGRPDRVGIDGQIELLLSTDTADVTILWFGKEAGDDMLSERSLVAIMTEGDAATTTKDDTTTETAEMTTAAQNPFAEALAGEVATDTTTAPTVAEDDLVAKADVVAEDVTAEDQAPETAEEASSEEATSEDVVSEEQVAEEAPATEAVVSYPVGEEDARIRIYKDDEFSTEMSMKGKSWTAEDRDRLDEMFRAGAPMADLVETFKRSPAAIIGCLARMETVVTDHPYAQLFAAANERRAAARAAEKAEKQKQAA